MDDFTYLRNSGSTFKLNKLNHGTFLGADDTTTISHLKLEGACNDGLFLPA